MSLAEIFSTASQSTCPVCSSDLADRTDTVDDLFRELSALKRDIASISTTIPELDSLIASSEGRLADLETSLRDNKAALDEAERSSQLLAGFREAALERATVRGRISLFLSAQPEAIIDEAIDARIVSLRVNVGSGVVDGPR